MCILTVKCWRMAWVFATLGLLAALAQASEPIRRGEGIESFGAPMPEIARRSPRIQYDLDLTQERYFVHVPANYTGTEPFGLIVFVHAGEAVEQLPAGWNAVLAQRKFLFVAAQQSGNGQVDGRRMGLAVLGALKMAERYKIDPQRVYAAGFSGGARVAGKLGFYQPDLFRGTIQCCGADFYEAVPAVHAKPAADNAAGPYGMLEANRDEIDLARKNVRFALITGSKDFRYGNILDIYQGGFSKAGFQAKLLDVPGMDHRLCDGKTLATAIAFLEPGKASPTGDSAASIAATQPGRPAWIAKEPSQWPQIVLGHDAQFQNNTKLQGASAFLMKLPNGAVVAATARHLLGGAIALDALDRSIKAWTLSPQGMSQRKVTLRTLAMDIQAAGEIDCLLMNPAPMRVWPVEVLTARTTPVEEGETVYLLGVPYGEKGSQNVYRAVVRGHGNGNQFAYEIEANVDTRGFSGAPVIDADGNAVGIHLGKYNQGPASGKTMAAALEISAVVPLANAAPAPAAKESSPAIQSTTPATPAKDKANADKAASALQMAKSLVAAKRYDVARQRLKAIIETYPDTPAAKEAQTVLNDIAGK